MSTTTETASKKQTVYERNLARQANVRRQLLDQLGTPPHLISVDVIPIESHSYRVNVRCLKQELGEAFVFKESRITDSFFVFESRDQFIDFLNDKPLLIFDPPIRRKYGNRDQ